MEDTYFKMLSKKMLLFNFVLLYNFVLTGFTHQNHVGFIQFILKEILTKILGIWKSFRERQLFSVFFLK